MDRIRTRALVRPQYANAHLADYTGWVSANLGALHTYYNQLEQFADGPGATFSEWCAVQWDLSRARGAA